MNFSIPRSWYTFKLLQILVPGRRKSIFCHALTYLDKSGNSRRVNGPSQKRVSHDSVLRNLHFRSNRGKYRCPRWNKSYAGNWSTF